MLQQTGGRQGKLGGGLDGIGARERRTAGNARGPAAAAPVTSENKLFSQQRRCRGDGHSRPPAAGPPSPRQRRASSQVIPRPISTSLPPGARGLSSSPPR
ncbi:hypothetical protein AAFF_G00141470 [Aldrovandia affinis]|uniref:Uncharacterized protein n=1 Tax=Aldrovandia affinis TaxID=143900 RepID=A0AAD7X334_9TELE|nr:hypothetical protein AAFF_G00141470 [Aldrovandia affinis]